MKMIEKGIYTGYVWMSDAQSPEILEEQEYSNDLEVASNPFVIEANLFDRKRNISVSVKFIDGKYYVTSVNLSDLETVPYDETVYVGKRMQGNNLKFRTYWRPVKDSGCMGMEVMRASESVFMGFEK